MTFVSCKKHLEAAVVIETVTIKEEIQRIKEQGGTDITDTTITIQPWEAGKCQICGDNSQFSVYYQCNYQIK